MSGQFLDCPDRFEIVRTGLELSGQFFVVRIVFHFPDSFLLSGQFLGCPESFWIIGTVSRWSEKFLNCPESLYIVWTVSILSGQFLNCSEVFDCLDSF